MLGLRWFISPSVLIIVLIVLLLLQLSGTTGQQLAMGLACGDMRKACCFW